MASEDYKKFMGVILEGYLVYRRSFQPTEEEITDHAVDSFRYASSAIKDPIVVEADKEPVRWLPEA
jgi:hypothetical protein